MPSVSISRSTALVGVCAALAVLVMVGQRLASTGAATAPEAAAPLEPAADSSEAVTAGPLAARVVVVHVVGAVHRPGLYRLKEGARVAEAVRRAGGATRRAYLGGINLAAPVVDGTQVLVPQLAPTSSTGPRSGAAPPSSEAGAPTIGPKLSLSSATAEQLDALPGVGPVTAQKILDYRAEHGAIGSVEELDAVPGIGPARLEQLRELVTP